jgi:hypothetical protein
MDKIKQQKNQWLLCSFVLDKSEKSKKELDYLNKKKYVKIKCVRCGQIRHINKDMNYSQPFSVMAICGRDKLKKERYLKHKEAKKEQYKDQQLPKDIVSKGKRYLSARSKWIDAGKPIRDDKTIIYIYDTICSKCEHFTGQSCDICGCRIVRAGHTLNKLAWDTENCPASPPKWKEGETRQDILLRQKNDQ